MKGTSGCRGVEKQRRCLSPLRRCLWPRHVFDYSIFSLVAPLGFSKSSATLAAADPCIPMLSYCALCLLEYWKRIPNARFPLVHTHVSSREYSAFIHDTFRSSCCVPSVESWVDDRRCPPGKPPCAFLAVALHPIPLATSSRFGEIPGGKGLRTTGRGSST